MFYGNGFDESLTTMHKNGFLDEKDEVRCWKVLNEDPMNVQLFHEWLKLC